MVRTYSYNPSTQGNAFQPFITESSPSSSSFTPSTPPCEVKRRENVELVPAQQRTVISTERCLCGPGFSSYAMPFHSPHIDPVGSIVGLRVLYVDGKLCYVPVEPQLNYMINQQFGNGFCAHHAGNLATVQMMDNSYNERKHGEQRGGQSTDEADVCNDSRLGTWTGEQRTRRWSTMDTLTSTAEIRSKAFESVIINTRTSNGNTKERTAALIPYNAISASMPNLSKRNLSESEQHKLDLLKQIEENKRRRELEKEQERLEEEREMQRIERYNEKIRREKEEEERAVRERARLAEKRNTQAYESRPPRQQRRMSSPRHEPPRSPSPNEAPRLEWWEKKPSWQQRAEDERVIPNAGSKPPRTPSHRTNSSRHSSSNYDPVASVENHKSEREGSRAQRRSQTPADHRASSAASEKRTSTRDSRRMSRHDSQTSIRSTERHLLEPAEDQGFDGNVAKCVLVSLFNHRIRVLKVKTK
ncbi:unnamed protein product [Nippostrongylus brasiliensis]|uniref:Uncharacterized protein n=1 Tax=Nippostrongylus brasiliensis TaxID=27835 RepID=A0A158R2P0_NIPBR|nr:unnamed protein product [Nippostrongylus brasiliensis]